MFLCKCLKAARKKSSKQEDERFYIWLVVGSRLARNCHDFLPLSFSIVIQRRVKKGKETKQNAHHITHETAKKARRPVTVAAVFTKRSQEKARHAKAGGSRATKVMDSAKKKKKKTEKRERERKKERKREKKRVSERERERHTQIER